MSAKCLSRRCSEVVKVSWGVRSARPGLPFSRPPRQSALRHIETAAHCAEKYSSNETGVGFIGRGVTLWSIPNAQAHHHRTIGRRVALARCRNSRSSQLWSLQRGARFRRVPNLQHARPASSTLGRHCASAYRARPLPSPLCTDGKGLGRKAV